MLIKDYLTKLLGIQGFKIVGLEISTYKKQPAVILDIERREKRYICSVCKKEFKAAYDSSFQKVQHLRLWEYITFLRFRKYRVNCPKCGIKTEYLPFIADNHRITRSLAITTYELCKVMTVKAVSIFQGLHRETVKMIDKDFMKIGKDSRKLREIKTIGIDEISVGKRHKYWHLISSMGKKGKGEVIYVGEGRSAKDVEKFWKWFGKERAKKIEYGIMDMWKGFINSFRRHCPQAKIIFDKFHIIRHLLEALNKVRKQELKKSNQRLKNKLSGKKFILLSRLANLRGRSRESLKELLSYSSRLFKAYFLKEIFPKLWKYKSKTWALKFWNNWKNSLKWSRLRPYRAFAKMIDNHIDGILGYIECPVSLGFIEATNLKARNIIRRAYGYRDKEYMQLKIIQLCSSSLSKFQPWHVASTHYNSS